MRSLDKCPRCHVGYMRTQTTRRTKFGCRIRYLRCSEPTCSFTGTERIPGEPRPRPKKRSKLEPNRPRMVRSRAAKDRASAMMKANCHAGADNREDRTMLTSIFQVAKRCGIDWQTARDWVQFGILPAPIIVGGFLRWRQADLDRWLEDGCQKSWELSDPDCEPFWDALLTELRQNSESKG